MDYFTYKKRDRNNKEERICLTSVSTSSLPVYNDEKNRLSSSLPSPPSTPHIPIHPSLSLPTHYLFKKEKKKIIQTKIHVLIVDDNSINLQILSKILTLHLNQYIQHIELVKSGIKALEILKCRPFDIIMMDIDMPILNGIETTKHIRSSLEFDILPKNRKIPIVAVTTNDSISWRQTYNDIGMNGCVGKPISIIELKSILSKVLDLPLIIPSTPE